MENVTKYFRMVKFSHTIFAMPFAMIGYFAGVSVVGFEWTIFVPILICMVAARNAAMGFNRLIDRAFDAANPRTSVREIPSGQVSVKAARVFVLLNCLLFVTAAGVINMLCLALSPVALLVVLGYSYTKRFTSLCHLVLGLGLSIAPIGAYLAVTGEFSAMMFIFGGLVLTWVSGFDIIFALQDVDFDRSANLHSVPSKLGMRKGLIVSGLLHLTTAATVGIIGWLYIYSIWYWIGAVIFCGLLLFQHLIVKPNDLSRVNLAFGTTNGMASVVFAVFTIVALFVVR